jgi:hypothetical protein
VEPQPEQDRSAQDKEIHPANRKAGGPEPRPKTSQEKASHENDLHTPAEPTGPGRTSAQEEKPQTGERKNRRLDPKHSRQIERDAEPGEEIDRGCREDH